METKRQVGVSSSSFTSDLFGPNDSSSSSSCKGLFGSVFGPPSTGLGTLKRQDLGNGFSNSKHGIPDNNTQGDKNKSGTMEPCYFSSSIYYGGQEVYSSKSQSTTSQPIFKKDGEQDDPNGSNLSGASRGNWWQESLYY